MAYYVVTGTPPTVPPLCVLHRTAPANHRSHQLCTEGTEHVEVVRPQGRLLVNMLRPTFTRLAAARIRQSPTPAMHGLRWLATTPATITRTTRTGTCWSSAMVMRPRNNWQVQTLQVRCMATMPEDELKKRMGT